MPNVFSAFQSRICASSSLEAGSLSSVKIAARAAVDGKETDQRF
jgi:hypothetical protein